MLTPDLVDLLESGVSILVGTRDAALWPSCARALGVRVHPGAAQVTVYVPQAAAGAVPDDIRDNGRVAVTFSRPFDHRTFQVKGTATVREAGEDERLAVEVYRHAFAVQLDLVGVPRRMTMRFSHWPAWAIDLRITDVFAQTPGPRSGERLPLGSGR